MMTLGRRGSWRTQAPVMKICRSIPIRSHSLVLSWTQMRRKRISTAGRPIIRNQVTSIMGKGYGAEGWKRGSRDFSINANGRIPTIVYRGGHNR